MAKPVDLSETLSITDEERKELLALYTEADALSEPGHTIEIGMTGSGKSRSGLNTCL